LVFLRAICFCLLGWSEFRPTLGFKNLPMLFRQVVGGGCGGALEAGVARCSGEASPLSVLQSGRP